MQYFLPASILLSHHDSSSLDSCLAHATALLQNQNSLDREPLDIDRTLTYRPAVSTRTSTKLLFETVQYAQHHKYLLGFASNKYQLFSLMIL